MSYCSEWMSTYTMPVLRLSWVTRTVSLFKAYWFSGQGVALLYGRGRMEVSANMQEMPSHRYFSGKFALIFVVEQLLVLHWLAVGCSSGDWLLHANVPLPIRYLIMPQGRNYEQSIIRFLIWQRCSWFFLVNSKTFYADYIIIRFFFHFQ